MVIFLSIIITLLGVSLIFIEKNIYNPFSIFLIFWGVIGILLDFRFFGMYAIENIKTYYIFFGGLLSYAIGCFFMMYPIKKDSGLSINKTALNYKPNYLIIDLSYFTALFFICSRLITVIPMMINGTPMKQIRRIYLDVDEGITSSGLEGMIEQFVLRPLNFVFIIFFSVILFSPQISKKRKIKYSVYTVGILFLYSVSTGGARVNFFLLLMVSIFSYFIFNKKNKTEFHLTRKQKYLMFSMVGVLTMLLYIFTAWRDPNGTVFNMIYRYFVGPIKHMDMWVTTIGEERTYGALFFHGILRPVTGVLKTLGALDAHPNYVVTAIQMHSNLEQFTYIGPSMLYNAFVTTFFYFYADFGMAGVFAGSMFYGGLSGYLYLKMKKNFNYLSLGFYLLIILGYYTSMVRWPFYESKYVLAFLFYRFFFFKKGNDLL